jgi:hypothetical protein
MRSLALSIALAALLSGGAARAAGSGKNDAPKDPGKGATGPSSPGEPPGGTPNEAANDARDAASNTRASDKSWEVGASYEFHHLIRQNDLAGAGVNKNMSYGGFYGRWDITPYDRLALRGGVYQRYLADPGETGARFDDLSLAYTRKIPLPGEVTLRPSFSLSAPTSFASQKASLITAPRLSLQADRRFWKWLTVEARVADSYYLVRYASAAGGNPNTRNVLSGMVSVDFAMPFHDPLSVGLTGYTAYIWLYDVANGGGGQPAQYGSVAQPKQPIQQSYGGEVYVRYNLPSVKGVKGDVSFALANGDPTLGYTSAIHDGAQHIYLFFRQTAEVYGAVALRY